MKLLTSLLLLAALPLCAQVNRYSATTGNVSLSGAGTALTIQQPASGGKLVTLESVQVYCSVTCVVSQAANGTAATATAGTANALLPARTPAAATVWTASNVGAGTAQGGVLNLSAGATQAIDVSKIVLGPSGTGSNYTVSIASVTGTVNITLIWNER